MPPGMRAPGPQGGPPGKGPNVEGDRWGKRALPPPPPGMGGGATGSLPALHQSENKFRVGLDLCDLMMRECFAPGST